MTHTIAQPGLHAHSWDPENDLMKQFVVQKRIEGDKGWNSLASFADYGLGFDYVYDRTPKVEEGQYQGMGLYDGSFRIWDQFEDEYWVFTPISELG